MTRYVLGEVLLIFGLTLAVMTAFMILLGVALEAARQGLGPEPILRLVPYVLPNALRFAVPAAILFSACSVYGRMSAANEIVAVKSLGISPMALLWPGLALSFLISLSAVWLNDLAASWGREGIQRVIMDSVEQIVYGTLRTHRSHRASDRLAITVRRVEGRKLVQPTITTQDARGRSMTITAREAELQSRPEHNALMLRLWDPVIESGDRGRLTWPGVLEQEIPLRDATKGADQGTEFIGDKGSLFVYRGGIRANPKELLKDVELPRITSSQANFSHVNNFFDCVKSRQTPVADISIGHRSATVCHLGNIAVRTNKKIVWDPKTETIVGDSEASKWLTKEYRKPWSLG